MKPMTDEQLDLLLEQMKAVRQCVTFLRLTRLTAESEDVRVALARLENWIAENDGRWVA